MRRLVAALAVALAGCSSSSSPDAYPIGAESFISSPPGGVSGGVATGAAGPQAPQAPSPSDGAGSAGRTVEEADVYAVAGTTLYVLNAYRGLQVVDLSDPAAPRLVGRAPLDGVPVDLYVRGGTALVLTRDHVERTVDAATGEIRAWAGSMLWAVDVTDPASPTVAAKLAIEGSLETTRLVGDVLYVVSNPTPYWYGTPIPVGGGVAVGAVAVGGDGSVAVASIDVSTPGDPRVVQTLSFPAAGWDTHAHVTPERITLSFAGYGTAGGTTRFRAIDISDPGGEMKLGAEVQVAGLVRDRWALDFDAATGLFRAVVANGWNSGATLYVFRWPAFDQAQRAGALALDVEEQLTAARFDANRVYAVTAIVRDPLWVIDTSDPEHPALAGHLEMPGQLDYVEPRGDRLVAFGHTNEAGGWWQLHVSLIDVSVAAAPALLKREVFGPDSGWLPASPDDFRKVFLVLDDLGLVVVPYQGWDSQTFQWKGGTQLLTFGRDALALRGFLPHAGDLKRAFPIGAGKLAALSDASLQTIDATQPDAPVEMGRIDLARSVMDLEVVGDAAVLAVGDGWRSGVELAVTPASDPDAAVPRARLPLATRSARLFRDGSVVWALATDWQQQGTLQAVDLSDPAAPRARGHVEVAAGAGGGSWWWGGLPDAVRVGHFLAVHQRGAWCTAGCSPSVLFYDLSDPDAPRLAASIALPGASWLGGLVASGSSVWAVHFAWADAGTWSRVRYYADRIDVAGDAPAITASVNVPGMLVAATDDGRLFTWDTTWGEGSVVAVGASGGFQTAQARTWVHALTLTSRGTARLDGSVTIDGSTSGFVADRGLAYGITSSYDASTSVSKTQLLAVRLDPLAVLPERPGIAGWSNLVAATSGKVFLQTGWPTQQLLVFAAGASGPAFEQAVAAPGWPTDVTVAGGKAYVAAGPFGVTTIPLNGVSSAP